MNKELLLYIQAQLAIGTSYDAIKQMLISGGGWREADIDAAFKTIQKPVAPEPVITSTKPAPAPSLAQNPTPKPVTPMQVAPTSAPVTPQPVPSPIAPKIETPKPATPQSTTVKPVSVAPTSIPAVQPQELGTSTPVSLKPAISEIVPKPITPQSTPPRPVVPPPAQATAPINITPKPVNPPAGVPTNISPRPEMAKPVASSNVPPVPAQVLPTSMALNDIKPPTPVQPMPAPAMSTLGASMSVNQGMQLEPKPVNKGKKVFIAVATVIVVLLLAAAAYAYTMILNPSPALAFKQALPSLVSSKTGHMKATISATYNTSAAMMLGGIPAQSTDTGVQISENTTSTAQIVIDGTFDVSDPLNQKSEITISPTASFVPANLSIQAKFVDSAFYVKIPEIGAIADLFGGNTGTFLPGDWVAFDKSGLAALEESEGIPLPSQGLTPDQKNAIKNLFISGGIITPTTELSKETFNGKSVHRYQFSVDQNALAQAFVKSIEIAGGEPIGEMDSAMVDQVAASLTVTDGELWVGVWDKKPYRIMFTIKPKGEVAEIVKGVKFDIAFDSFGGAVTIVPPASSKPLTSLVEEAQKKSADAIVTATINSARAMAEIYYSNASGYKGVCVAPEDGLVSLVESLEDFDPYCKDSAKEYAIAAKLSSTPGYICADSGGEVVTIAQLPTGTSCK